MKYWWIKLFLYKYKLCKKIIEKLDTKDYIIDEINYIMEKWNRDIISLIIDKFNELFSFWTQRKGKYTIMIFKDE